MESKRRFKFAVGVKSAALHFELRAAIRETWLGAAGNADYCVRFLVGSVSALERQRGRGGFTTDEAAKVERMLEVSGQSYPV